MQQKRNFLPIFSLFIIVSILFIFLSSRNLLIGENFFQNTLFSLQTGFFKILSLPSGFFHHTDLEKLQEENLSLTSQLAQLRKVEQDNVALRDQFETTNIPSQQLLSAEIIGDPQFVPGISMPESLIVRAGLQDGVEVGDAAVYTDTIVGIVTKITDHTALVTVMSNKAVSSTAKTSSTNAQGVLTGQGGGQMVLGNVVLSDTLRVGDLVVTSGSQDIGGHGFPPGLIVGKIISVSKTPSSLYQSASVESLLHVEKLPMVFIVK